MSERDSPASSAFKVDANQVEGSLKSPNVVDLASFKDFFIQFEIVQLQTSS